MAILNLLWKFLYSFSTVFYTWFFILLAFFITANFMGLVRAPDTTPYRYTGFPFTVALWGVKKEAYFSWTFVLINSVIALAISFGLSLLIARNRLKNNKKL